RADYPATMVATTRGDDLMVANALRGNEAYCKNTNGARRHAFRALHLPTAASPRAPRAPPCAIYEGSAEHARHHRPTNRITAPPKGWSDGSDASGRPCDCLRRSAVGAENHSPQNDDEVRRGRGAADQCAVSVAASSSSGASSGAAAAAVVVSSHSIGSGLRVIARASTSSMRETATISRPFLMLSLISTRSLAFSSGMSTVLMPPRKAASSFSLRPAIGHTRP